jgi:hypothetical protein
MTHRSIFLPDFPAVSHVRRYFRAAPDIIEDQGIIMRFPSGCARPRKRRSWNQDRHRHRLTQKLARLASCESSGVKPRRVSPSIIRASGRRDAALTAANGALFGAMLTKRDLNPLRLCATFRATLRSRLARPLQFMTISRGAFIYAHSRAFHKTR